MKRLLIVGGSGKIGSALALHFLNEGNSVAITYNKSVERVNELANQCRYEGSSLLKFQLDLRDLSKINELDNFIASKFGQIDVLIFSAGVFPKSELKLVNEKDFDEIISINLKSNFFLIKKLSELMSENSVVINFSSVGGIIPWKNRSLYHITKSGVISLTKSLALELAPKVRVNSIAPGYIEFEGSNSREKMPLSKIPLNRYGTINHIIQTVEFLINNDYITGVTIPIDGGRLLVL